MKLTLAFLLIMTLAVFPACTQPTDTTPPPDATTEAEDETALPSEPPPDTTTPEQEETEEPPATITEEDIEAARQVVFAYFDALNNYNLEAALACMEESWANEKEPGLISEISQMESFGVTLTIEEEAEPTVTDDNRIEIYTKIDVSMALQPDRHAIYQLMKIEDEWKICFSEDTG